MSLEAIIEKIEDKVLMKFVKTFGYSMNDYKGVQPGLVFAVTRGDFKGLQTSPTICEVEGDMYGAQFSGFNTVEGNAKGGLNSYLVNIVKGCLEGYAIGATNYAKHLKGFGVGITNAYEILEGVLVGGVGSAGTAKGFLMNAFSSSVTKRFDGVEIAPICYAPDKGNYFQVGLITIRKGEGPWYKRITPFIGWHREKKK